MAAAETPFRRLARLIEKARSLGIENPDAMALSTVAADGTPSSRQVLLKHLDERGLVFYTNLESPKSQDLQGNARVSLNFYWRELGEQVRVRGRASQVPDEEADAYFATRDRGSQLGAWASHQSRPLDGKARLLADVARLEARHVGRAVPRPDFWSGFRVEPSYFEFWSAGRFRLHDRFAYERDGDDWVATRLYP
jgi:pyridoxamine 5'-phosphate oxidase